VGFDELRQREQQRRHRRMTWIAVGSTAGMAITLGLAAVAWQARNDAQRRQDQAEGLLGFMLGDLRAQLVKLNKLEVLDAVGEKAMAYFASLDTRDLSDAALTRQVAALRQIGENRNDQGRDAEAMRSFLAAYESAKVLAARHPENGDMLFERAQAEYWVGIVLRKRQEVAATTEWLVRYRDTGAALVALNPTEPRWQEELAWGHHNLAVVDFDRGKLEEGRRGFLGELAVLARLSGAKPADLALQYRIVDANSWLGSIAERSGDLGEAVARCAEQVARMEAIARAEPDNAKWRGSLATKLALQASILAITGQRGASKETRGRAKELFDALAAGDPKNVIWLKNAISCRAREAQLAVVAGDLPRVRQLVQEVKAGLERYSAAGPANRDPADRNLGSWLDWAVLEAVSEPGTEIVNAGAIELGEASVAKGGVVEVMLVKLAQARVAAGRMAARAGDQATAQKHWRRALEVLDARWERSNDWRVLDPAARAFALLGDTERQRAIVARLDQMNYRPIEPWPDPGSR
jgi:serine/threonine-protein kinase